MNTAELLRLIEAHEKREQELEASCLSVWAALSDAEPELTREVLQLFSTVTAAARWVSTSCEGNQNSPAREAAEGLVSEVIARVRKTVHGFVA